MTHPASLITISRLACVSLTAAAACTVMTLAPTSDSTWAQTGVLATGCPHISERRTELGCYTTAVEIIGELPQLPLYWHLDNYPTRAAAEAAKQARGTVVESLGKVWLFTIADADWRPAGGERTAKIGPLPLSSGGRFTATYLEAITLPGFQTIVHRQPGDGVCLVVWGSGCLEARGGGTVCDGGVLGVGGAGDVPGRGS